MDLSILVLSKTVYVRHPKKQINQVEADEPMAHLDIPELLALKMANMEPARSDILRAAPAYRALAFCALPLRGFRQGNLVHLSTVTDRIDEFWSQSWHGPRWRLILTVVFLNNSLAAAVVSVAIALVLGVLYACKVLPVMYKYDYWFQELPRSGWSAYGAILFYYFTLLAWQRRKTIFLDVLCIDQESKSDKMAALLSMGAFLKRSDAMLVLWDETYMRRLWCVFELAAFLKSRPAGKKTKLLIRPTITGPCFIGITFSLNLILNAISYMGDLVLLRVMSFSVWMTSLFFRCFVFLGSSKSKETGT